MALPCTFRVRPIQSIRFFLFACVLLLAATRAWADGVSGRVLDPQDRPVRGATVMLVTGQTVHATARTHEDGTFGPIDVAPGTYTVLVAAPGLSAPPQTVDVRAQQTATLDIHLAIAARGESIVVSASSVETPLSRVSDSVTIIDRQTLQQIQVTTVADAVRLAPGFSVAASGGPGALTSFFPRGGEADYTEVLVDGIPQNAFGGAFDAAHLPSTGIERIEVVRGPESALYGSGAIAGLVQIITRQGGPLDGSASIEGGGYGTTHVSATGSGSKGPWSWGASADRFGTDGDTRQWPSIGQRVTNDDYGQTTGSASLSWSDRTSRRLRLDIRGGRDERGTPGPYGSDPADLFASNGGLDPISRQRDRNLNIGGSAILGEGSAIVQRLQTTWTDAHGSFLARCSFCDTGTSSSDDETHRLTGRYQIDTNWRTIGVSAGAELLRERADNTFVQDASGTAIPVRRNDAGFFVEARPSLSPRLLLSAGVRVDRIARAALPPDAFGSRPALDRDIVWSANPKISGAWFVRPVQAGDAVLGSTKLHASAGTGIKPPTAFDLGFTTNPDLKPERNRSVEAGIEQSFAHSRVIADVTWFDNRYEDLIVSIASAYQQASRYTTDNISNARARGAELSLSWRAPAGFSIRTAWTALQTRILDLDRVPGQVPAPYVVGDSLVRRPAQQGSLEVDWTGRRATAFVLLTGRGHMLDLEPNFAATTYDNPGYTTTSIGGSVPFALFDLYGRVTNLFDRDYEEVLGFPAEGRSAIVGIRVHRRR